jgi:hypothetical protein
MLSDAKIRSLKPREKAYKVYDHHGLSSWIGSDVIHITRYLSRRVVFFRLIAL